MFEVIGERINTSRKNIQKATENRDTAFIRDDIKKQLAAGASYIDVNAGARIGHEKEDMKWLLDTIGSICTVPLCLDSPDPAILEMGYSMVDKAPMINSISLEQERFDTMIPFLKGKDCKIIALCMDDSGMPSSSSDIVKRAKKLISELTSIGMKHDSIYIDPLIQPISTDTTKGIMVLDAVSKIKKEYNDVHIAGGLSNISYGLPQRRIINRTFLTLMMAAGMDSAIVDPLDATLMATIKTADMLLGNDNYCMEYLKRVRSNDIKY